MKDIEKNYSRKAFIAKLRRLADALERDKRFSIQVAGKRIDVPSNAMSGVEYECEDGIAQIELQITWKTAR